MCEIDNCYFHHTNNVYYSILLVYINVRLLDVTLTTASDFTLLCDIELMCIILVFLGCDLPSLSWDLE